MNYKDNIEWLKSLKQQIGQTQHRDLWHFEQVIDETIDNLKPLATPHGRLIDVEVARAEYPILEQLLSIIPTVIKAEVSE